MTPRRFTIIGLIAILFAVGVLGARPAYRFLKIRRAQTFAHTAESLIIQKRWQESFQKAQAAYQLAPQEPIVLRAVAHLYTAMAQPQAFLFWQKLLETSRGQPSDLQEIVQLSLRLNILSQATHPLKQLLDQDSSNPRNLRLAAEFFYRLGDLGQAIAYSRQAVDLNPADNSNRLFYAQLLLASPHLTDQIEGKEILWLLAEGQTDFSLEALALLAQIKSLSLDQIDKLIQRLQQHPRTKIEHQLLACELQFRKTPEFRNRLIAELILKHQNSDWQTKLVVGRWLNREKEYTQTLKLLPADSAMQKPELLLIQLDALAGLRRWPHIAQIMGQENLPLEGWMAELYRARVAQELGQAEQAALHWRRVHLEASQRPQSLWYIAQYAEHTGVPFEAVKAYRRLAQEPAAARSANLALVRLAEKEGNTRGLRELLKELALLNPDDHIPRNDLAYLHLLLNENIQTAKGIAEKLVEQFPQFLAFRTTLALAHLRLNEFAAAKQLYEGLRVNWTIVLPSWQAVHAAVRGANGETNLARALARQIPREKLKPEERELLQPWL